jgi:acyl carrier protein
MEVHNLFKANPGVFAQAVETCIRDGLRDAARTQGTTRPRPLSACDPEIDSLVVVQIICAIEEITGVTLPATFAPRGGYDDVETCVADLVSVTKAVWEELVKEKEHHDQ